MYKSQSSPIVVSVDHAYMHMCKKHISMAYKYLHAYCISEITDYAPYIRLHNIIQLHTITFSVYDMTILLVAAIIYNVATCILHAICYAWPQIEHCSATNQHNTKPICYSLLFLSLLHCVCASVISGMLCSTLGGSVDTHATCTCVCYGSARVYVLHV